MALDRATLREVGSAFLEALQLGGDRARVVDHQLDQLAELLPRPEAWATLGQGDKATLALLTGDVLLTVSRETANDGEGQLVVTSHRLSITEVRYRRDNQYTVWDFEFRDRDPLRVEGRMNDLSASGAAETFDRAEALARALAASMGWPVVEQASVRDQDPDEDELADGGSSTQTEPRRQQVTDLWGTPISKPKRRNR